MVKNGMVRLHRRVNHYFFWVAILFLFVSSAQALSVSVEDAQLLKKEYQQYQAWVVSRDYLFGTTSEPDPIKALAWQLIYVGMLPASYPEKDKLLTIYKQNLSFEQVAEATQLAQSLRIHYGLHDSFNEAELYRVYILHEENVSWSDLPSQLDGRPPLIFTMLTGNKKTGVVGRVVPWAGIEKSNMVLRLMAVTEEEGKDPWFRPYLALTVTDSGQFYATGLSPGRYELYINTAGLSTSKQFTVRNNEIRGLSLIDLRKFIP